MFLVWTSNHHSIQKLTAQINTILLWQQFGHIRFRKKNQRDEKYLWGDGTRWGKGMAAHHIWGDGSKSSCSQQDSQQHQPAHPSWGGWRPLWWPNPVQTVMTSAWLWYLPPVVTSTSRAHTAAGWQAAPQRQQIAWIHGCKHTLKQLPHDEKHKKTSILTSARYLLPHSRTARCLPPAAPPEGTRSPALREGFLPQGRFPTALSAQPPQPGWRLTSDVLR